MSEWKRGQRVRREGVRGTITHYKQAGPAWVIVLDEFPDPEADFPDLAFASVRGITPDVVGWVVDDEVDP